MTLMCLMLLAFMWTSSGHVNKSFPCPDTQAVFTIQHEIVNVLNCEQTWVLHNSPIAIYTDNEAQCAAPCVNVSHGGITLNECVSVVLTITCGIHELTDMSFIFSGKKESSSPVQDHPESTNMHIGLILTAVMCFVICWVAVIRRRQELTLARPAPKPDGPQAVQATQLSGRDMMENVL